MQNTVNSYKENKNVSAKNVAIKHPVQSCSKHSLPL